MDNNDEVAVARSIGVKVGKDCHINDNARKVFSMEPYLVTLGNKVVIAPEVRFVCHDGGIAVLRGNEDFGNIDCFAPIIVGDNVFIGIKSVILPGVKIGNNVVIGACSLVNKDVPDDTVVAGVPAKKICDISQFKEKIKDSDKKFLVPTKGMSAEQKKEYLMNNFPYWFNK
ncbi:MAG: acyltransferase [Clostridia bacterium]|nr:acyltransferase [Clostridia bacterium]